MRIKSLSQLPRQYRMVTLDRADEKIELKVAAFPLGHRRDFERICPIPNPPRKTTQHKIQGTQVTEDYADPAYLALMEEHNELSGYYLFWLALRHDDAVEFTNKPNSKDALNALGKEIVDFGFTEGDKFQIMRAAMEASGMTEELLEKAKAGF